MRLNKNQLTATLVIVLIVLGLWGGVSVFAQPGDADDPLVSKSYVDEQINRLLNLIANISNPGTDTPDTTPDTADTANPSDTFTVVQVPKGVTVYGLQGTEIILRGGSAKAVSGVNGLCDITAGVDVTDGMTIQLNHLLIVPKDDGRGLVTTAEAWLMIKGGYYTDTY